jgi:hypothetical protein
LKSSEYPEYPSFEQLPVLRPSPNSSNIVYRSGRRSARHHPWRDIMHCTAASKSRALTAAAAIAAFLGVAAAVSAQEATEPKDHAGRIEALKASVISGIEARRKLAQVMNDTVFSFGELAYQEFETSKYLTGVLEKNGRHSPNRAEAHNSSLNGLEPTSLFPIRHRVAALHTIFEGRQLFDKLGLRSLALWKNADLRPSGVPAPHRGGSLP